MPRNSQVQSTTRTGAPLTSAGSALEKHASCVAAGTALAGTLAVATAAVVASGALPALV